MPMIPAIPDVGVRTRRRIAWRLLPFVFLLYLVAYLDRANVSFAALKMNLDLGFSDRIYGLGVAMRSEEHTSELQSQSNLVCRLLLEKKKACKCSTTRTTIFPTARQRPRRLRSPRRAAHRPAAPVPARPLRVGCSLPVRSRAVSRDES